MRRATSPKSLASLAAELCKEQSRHESAILSCDKGLPAELSQQPRSRSHPGNSLQGSKEARLGSVIQLTSCYQTNTYKQAQRSFPSHGIPGPSIPMFTRGSRMLLSRKAPLPRRVQRPPESRAPKSTDSSHSLQWLRKTRACPVQGGGPRGRRHPNCIPVLPKGLQITHLARFLRVKE